MDVLSFTAITVNFVRARIARFSLLLVLVLLITGESNQACYPIKYKIKLINIKVKRGNFVIFL